MQWAVLLAAFFATVSSISCQKCPGEVESLLIFPDGTLPDLVPKRCRHNQPLIRLPKTNCEASCENLDKVGEEDDEWRLSRDIIPVHYDLQLDVYVNKFQFTGTAEITVTAKNPTEFITLHSDDLKINNLPEIFQSSKTDGDKIKWAHVLSITEDKKHLTATLHLSKALEADKYYIFKIEYSGEIRQDLLGFYRSSYKVGHETRWLATTQFEPTHARRAFPCFDEPNLKATFDIRITHEGNYTALSNMPIKRSSRKAGRVTDEFQTTPKMSTYLIAFIISDFKPYKTSSAMSTVWASEDFIKDAAYSQKKGVEALRELIKFTDMKFLLPKIDHVGIPDFNAGAMENWGLITYRDYLLIKRKDTNSPTKQYIPGVISHELAHQWFGNLVTLDWWSYTWLNEGFATFFEYYITDIIEDKFAMWNQFIPSKFQVALELDGNTDTSVAMSRSVSTPEDIANKFDQISYGKGGCILRMISELLTHDKFRDGLRKYLNTKKMANAKPEDLFEQLESVSSEAPLPKGTKFSEFAKSWTEQAGVPVVTAIRNYKTGEVTFSQQRHFDKKPACDCSKDRQWWIPLTWISQKDSSGSDKFTPKAWLRGDTPDENVVAKTDIKPGQWLLLNPRSVGYYRVNYDTKNWLLLTKNLAEKPQTFPTQNRAQIINDAFLLASSDHLDFAVALEAFNFLPKERDTSVWMSATRIISRLVDEMGSTEGYPLLEQFGKKIMSDVFYTVGLKPNPKEKHLVSLLRYYVGPWTCLFGVEQCIKDATENLEKFVKDPNSVHPDVVTATVCGAVKGANEDTFWKIRNSVDNLAEATDQALLVSALGRCHPDDKLVKQHLEDILKEDSQLSDNIKLIAIRQVLAAPSKFNLSLNFIKENLDKLVTKFGKDTVTALVNVLILRVRTESQYKEVGEWLKANVNKVSNPDKVTAALTNAHENTKWTTYHLSDVTDWLAATLGVESPPGIPTPPPPTENPQGPITTTPSPPHGNVALIRAAPILTATVCLLPLVFTN